MWIPKFPEKVTPYIINPTTRYMYILYIYCIKIYHSNLSTPKSSKNTIIKPQRTHPSTTCHVQHPKSNVEPVLELNDTSIQLWRTITFRFQTFNLRLTVLRDGIGESPIRSVWGLLLVMEKFSWKPVYDDMWGDSYIWKTQTNTA